MEVEWKFALQVVHWNGDGDRDPQRSKGYYPAVTYGMHPHKRLDDPYVSGPQLVINVNWRIPNEATHFQNVSFYVTTNEGICLGEPLNGPDFQHSVPLHSSGDHGSMLFTDYIANSSDTAPADWCFIAAYGDDRRVVWKSDPIRLPWSTIRPHYRLKDQPKEDEPSESKQPVMTDEILTSNMNDTPVDDSKAKATFGCQDHKMLVYNQVCPICYQSIEDATDGTCEVWFCHHAVHLSCAKIYRRRYPSLEFHWKLPCPSCQAVVFTRVVD